MKVSGFLALKNLYILEKTIGTGGFGKVKLATHILTGEKVAIKIMEKACLGDDLPRIEQEIKALKQFSHHHICQLYQVIETETHYFMVIEYCSGGELFDHIVEKNRLSEMESRSFFRQILSAVAYLHSLGYAHRDLKPENVLLDHDQTLKLIDFGLCAKPIGGLDVQLLTSCGSPTYAAPELIQGKKYLGPEVDVWSMGVLLYAILCGFLPFDSDRIEVLYRKILRGRYEEPAWLSQGSKRLIKRMLTLDPLRRVTVKELLNHEWVQLGYNEPVSFEPLYDFHMKDDACVSLLAEHHNLSSNDMWAKLSRWDYDYDTATYLILVSRKRQSLPLKLNPVWRVPTRTPYSISSRQNVMANSPSSFMNSPIPPEMKPLKTSTQISLGITNDKTPSAEDSTRKRTLRKRARSPLKESSRTPVAATPVKRKMYAASSDSNENSTRCPNSPAPSATPSTPSSAYKLLTNIEKKFNQVRQVLTPRKKGTTKLEPAVLAGKALLNVSTASSSNPTEVLEQLKQALANKGIESKAKGFMLRGKADVWQGKSCKLSFELEVCLIPSIAGSSNLTSTIVGIRRKRLKGDSWCYKQICEEVLGLAGSSKETAPSTSKA
ncbi:maternal embryonic leucine zipper kinase [Bemisia tabaci]|nr:PREDICTED: maternal embryonic leucine zipper kinase-like [Bemisia tabaci]